MATRNQYINIIHNISAFLRSAKPRIYSPDFLSYNITSCRSNPYVNLLSLNQYWYWFQRKYLNYYYLSFINHTYSLTTGTLLTSIITCSSISNCWLNSYYDAAVLNSQIILILIKFILNYTIGIQLYYLYGLFTGCVLTDFVIFFFLFEIIFEVILED